MSFTSWLRNVRSSVAPGQMDRKHRRRRSLRAATRRPHIESLEDRCVPALYAVTDLGTLGGWYSHALDLNQSGQVVGDAGTADGFSHAFLSDHGTMIDLGTLGGTYSSAAGVNDLGQVVGWAYLPDDASYHAFIVNPQGGEWFQDSDLDGESAGAAGCGVSAVLHLHVRVDGQAERCGACARRLHVGNCVFDACGVRCEGR